MGSKDIKNLCMGYDEKQRALMVYGYTGYIKDDWFAMPAFGRRYHEYGIADGSVGQQRLTLHVGVVDDRHMLRAGDCRIVEDGVQPKVHDGIQLAEDQLTFLASSSQ